MELYYILVQNAPPPLRHVLCERVAAADGFWLYKYIPRYDKYIDYGYAEDLGQLKLIITQKYGLFEETFLVRGFEEAAKLFALRAFPRIIYLRPGETFCTRISGELFFAVLKDGDIDLAKWLDSRKPRSLEEALERLSEYAEKTGMWIILKHGPNYASAYGAYPSP